MAEKTLKQKTIQGVIWSFVERFGFLSIQFISNLVLARLLAPEDFGAIGMIMVFITLATVFVDGGLGAALIQKKCPTKQDYSTIFILNIILSIFFYGVIFISANNIAIFYNLPILNNLLKCIGIILILDSLCIVQNNILIKNLDFKKVARIKIIAAFIGCTFAISCSVMGLGVWSLVVQYLITSIVKTVFFWGSTKWIPELKFSKESFKDLFSFGSKLLAANLLSEIYRNFQSLIIGKVFSSRDLGFYTQAKQLESIPASTLIMVINQVTFPVFAQTQDDKKRLNEVLCRSLKTISFVNFPIMVLLTIVAEPLFNILYTDKWAESIPYFQGLCLGFGFLIVIHNMNINVLKAVGRSDMVLQTEMLKKIFGVILILGGMQWGVLGMILGLGINSYIEFFINSYCVGKATGFGILKQLRIVLPAFVLSLLSGAIVYITFSFLKMPHILNLFSIILTYLILYLGTSYALKFSALTYMIEIFKEKLKK